jgi:hypothetical protein
MNTNSEDLREKAYKIWRTREAEESERRRQEGKVAIWLERGPNDAETFTKEHQAELHDIIGALHKDGIELEAPFMAVDAADAIGGYTGQLVISLAQSASPFLLAALVAWLKGRPPRKVRIEFHANGKVKTIEAQTDDQVLSLVKTLDKEARAKVQKTRK